MRDLSNVKKFREASKKLPTTITSTTVQELCADKLAAAKIEFFASVGAQCEPLLKRYQTSSHEADSVAKLIKIDVNNKESV